MIGEQLGAYAIRSELGSGGMGKVYLAEAVEATAGLEPGTKVALKLVHPQLLETPGFFKRFMQEADLGKRVRHENVVRTFDVDALMRDGSHYHFMVMEYVQGRNLRELLAQPGAIPESLLREIALQAAAGLAAIHAQGIVHRDLKPENILITDEHEIRIMDLGVAKLQEATIAITREGQFAGSLLYAAPEQFGKEEVGPPADLYSFGVLLYELATGQNPFRSDNAAAVIQAHLNETPPRARERNEDLSLLLSEIIATLLAKAPAERFASASALQTVLAEGERSEWWIKRAPLLYEQGARLPRIRVRREAKLHGRAHDLQALHDAWDEAKNGAGSTVFLEGEAGIGKTRLIDAYLRGLEDDDLHVLYGSYPPSGGMGGLSEAILGKFGEARLADALAPYLTVTPSLVPAFAALIKHESSPTGAEPLSGDALQAVVVHLLRALAAEKPTVWIVDDLHFAPQESRDLLMAMARAVEDHRILLVATARPGVGVEEFSRLDNFRRASLARLSAREVVELLADAFKSADLAEKLAGKIAVKSDGVPFFIFEMIRGLKEGQFIRQELDGSYVQTQVIDEIEVPSAVKDLIGGRLRGLTRDERAILDAGAVCGMTFDPGLVAQVLAENRVGVLRALAEIERRHGLVRGEEGRTRFDQNQIQEVLYSGLTPDLRAEYHSLLAVAHAERCADGVKGDDAVFVAHHHLRGSRPEAARQHVEPALEHLASGYRSHTLLDLAQRALQTEGLLAGKERVEVLLRLAGRLEMFGRRDEERVALDEAVALADETGDKALHARARRALGAHFGQTSRIEAAEVELRKALALALEAGDQQVEARATGNLGNVFHALQRHAEARAHHERHRALSHEIQDRHGESLATGNLGDVAWSLGDYAEAQIYYERQLALGREIGDRREEVRAIGALGALFSTLGRYAAAQEYLERQRELSREIGDRSGEARATGNLGNLFDFLGLYAAAEEHTERGRVLSREIGDRHSESASTANLGDIYIRLGRHAAARECQERACALSREIGDRRGEGYALANLGALAEAEGDVAGAVRFHREALALRRELGAKDAVAFTLVALGRIESSPALLDEALALARETEEPGTILSAAIERARLPGGDVEAALAALAELEEGAEHTVKMDAHFRLWELTRDRAHLEEAHRLLAFMRDHAPEDCRDSMIENLPLHREITKAWAEHGGTGEQTS